MKNKEELVQAGYELLGKYSEELFSYFKLTVQNDIPGVAYYLVDQKGSIVGTEKFVSKKDLALMVNIQERLASNQRKLFAKTNKKPGNKKRNTPPVKAKHPPQVKNNKEITRR